MAETVNMHRLQVALQDGLAHGSQIQPHDPKPGEAVTLFFFTNAFMPIERVAVYYTLDDHTPSGFRGVSANSEVILAEPEEAKYDSNFDLPIQRWHAVLPGQTNNTFVRYRADAWSLTEPDLHWYADNVDTVSALPSGGREFAYHVDDTCAPEWSYDAVIYQIVIDRFWPGQSKAAQYQQKEISLIDFFGGTLSGVIEKLEYLQTLGVNCLCLTPVFESPSYHGYDPSSHYNVAKHYGGNAILLDLVEEAHKRGMRILLDFVANHTSDTHPLFLDALHTPDSPKARWYGFDSRQPHGYHCFWSVPTMPELITERSDIQRYLADVALHWLSYYKVDGLRLDYVLGPPHAFWTFLRHEIKQRFPHVLLLGEITAPLDEITAYAGRIDTFMEFDLTELLRKVFAHRSVPLADMLSSIEERNKNLEKSMNFITMLDNHDMNRFLWEARGHRDRLMLAATCHMTLEGIPNVYYGTEVGLSQDTCVSEELAYARAPMLWGEEQDLCLLEHYRKLIMLRRTQGVLRRGAWKRLQFESNDAYTEDQQVGAYLRWLDREFLVIILNNRLEPATLRLQLVEQLLAVGIAIDPSSMLYDLLEASSESYSSLAVGWVEIALPALGAIVLGNKFSTSSSEILPISTDQ